MLLAQFVVASLLIPTGGGAVNFTAANQDPLTVSLDRAPDRKAQWLAALDKAPKAQQSAFKYILTYMPLADLRGLDPKLVSRDIAIAFRARKATSWASSIPTEIFLDSVVPYASVTEPRDSMRGEFQSRYIGLAQKAKTPGEAAVAINAALFKDYKVVYNTHRLRTDQSAPETIRQGMATCTGLSIMLVEALRAVGVPSRLAGIPDWPESGGNHTWVEVWDQGDWHFVGAAEPDAQGLDHAWFKDKAAGAIADQPTHAIYAVTYKDGGSRFPLVWLPGETTFAENVTARYKAAVPVAGPSLSVEVLLAGERVIADVMVCPVGEENQCIRSKSLGPQADINNHLKVMAKEGSKYTVTVTYQGKTVVKEVVVKGDTMVRVAIDK